MISSLFNFFSASYQSFSTLQASSTPYVAFATKISEILLESSKFTKNANDFYFEKQNDRKSDIVFNKEE
jgi:hypothetical protein